MSHIEKEKLIKADIASIENRIRHAFNQGYDLGFKDGKERAKPLEQEPCEDATLKDIFCMGCEYKEPNTKNDLGVDCISRIGVLRLLANSIGKTNTYLQTEVLKMPSVTPQEPRWIPVSEYLPVTNDEVLVTYIVNGNHKKRYVETASCFDGEWSSVNDEYRIPNTKIEIIAWCEMPKPYKAEI